MSLFLLHFRLTTNETLDILEDDDSDFSELSEDDGEDFNVILMTPTETQFAESDQDSDASDEGALSLYVIIGNRNCYL